jgi:hypothetical protein
MNMWATGTFLGPVTSGKIYNFYAQKDSITHQYEFWYNNTVDFNNFDNPKFINPLNGFTPISIPNPINFVGDEVKVTYLGGYSYYQPIMGNLVSTSSLILPSTHLYPTLNSFGTSNLFNQLIQSAFDTEVYTLGTIGSYSFSTTTINFYHNGLFAQNGSNSSTPNMEIFNVTNNINDGMTHYAVSISNYADPNSPPPSDSFFDIFYDIAVGTPVVPEPHIYVLIGSMLALAYVLGRKRVQA